MSPLIVMMNKLQLDAALQWPVCSIPDASMCCLNHVQLPNFSFLVCTTDRLVRSLIEMGGMCSSLGRLKGSLVGSGQGSSYAMVRTGWTSQLSGMSSLYASLHTRSSTWKGPTYCCVSFFVIPSVDGILYPLCKRSKAQSPTLRNIG